MGDARLCGSATAVGAAARDGEDALRLVLNRPRGRGGVACSGETLVGTRVPALLTAAGVIHYRPPHPDAKPRAPCGGRGSLDAMGRARAAVADHIGGLATAAEPSDRATLQELAARIRTLDVQDLADGLVEVLQAEPLLAHRLVPSVLPCLPLGKSQR